MVTLSGDDDDDSDDDDHRLSLVTVVNTEC